ncbi:MAG: hypothetical protein NC930_07445 [Candidatus Omnitrophica bacterium]|nr:hypothetical protein [Candidatus Omnitrophota bacterium]
MKSLQILYRVLYTVGFSVLVSFFLYLEWETLRDDSSKVINPLVHLGVILAFLTKPLVWAAFLFMFIGHMGELLSGKEE